MVAASTMLKRRSERSVASEVELTVAGDMTIVSDAELAFADVEAAVAEAGDYTVSAVG